MATRNDNKLTGYEIVRQYTVNESVDTSGYQEISNNGSLGTFASATVAGIPTQTDYTLKITMNGTLRSLAALSIGVTDTWAQVAAEIQADLRTATSGLETVAIVGGKIKVSSTTTGPTSTVLIEAGAVSGSGDILTAIDAIGATYETAIEAAVDGTTNVGVPLEVFIEKADRVDGRSLVYICTVKDSSDVNKSDGITSSWSASTGILTVSDGTTQLEDGDVVTVIAKLNKA